MDAPDQQLDSLRGDLDKVDDRLVSLINERADLARRIGQVKSAAGLRVYAPDREREVLARIRKLNRGPIDDRALCCVYRELMSASLSLERTPRIAILGPAGSFSHLAGRRRFGSSVDFDTVAGVSDVFDAVEQKNAEFGLVPVENSSAGGIGETLDALVERNVLVCGEVRLAIHHHLLARCPIEAVERVYSKPEVFSQCHDYLSATGLAKKTIGAGSTSAAAERASTEVGAAAIAGDLAAELFDIPKLAEFIEDDRGNVTRFLVIGTAQPKPTGTDRTSIVFSVGHEPGTLVEALDSFRQAGINMTRIESRPDRRRRWGYYFFVDVEGHQDTPAAAEQLRATAQRCSFWKILGSYPIAEEIL